MARLPPAARMTKSLPRPSSMLPQFLSLVLLPEPQAIPACLVLVLVVAMVVVVAVIVAGLAMAIQAAPHTVALPVVFQAVLQVVLPLPVAVPLGLPENLTCLLWCSQLSRLRQACGDWIRLLRLVPPSTVCTATHLHRWRAHESSKSSLPAYAPSRQIHQGTTICGHAV